MLTAEGHEVVTAESGPGASEQVQGRSDNGILAAGDCLAAGGDNLLHAMVAWRRGEALKEKVA